MELQRTPDLEAEFADAKLGDQRLTKRLLRIAHSLSDSPGESLPTAAGSDGELEGVYRFFSNSRVSAEAVLAPHYAATRARCSGSEDVLVLHDTTNFVFRGDSSRVGLGRIQRSGRLQSSQGFFGHFALAVSADGVRQPLGIVGLRTFVRDEMWDRECMKVDSTYVRKEAARWTELALDVQGVMPNSIHVMDREADSFENYRTLLASGARFVIRGRAGWKRVGESAGVRATLPELAAKTPIRLTRLVRVSRRTSTDVGVLNKAHPVREERDAKLTVRATQILLPCPHYLRKRNPGVEAIPITVVCVEEENPPRGVEPVSWMLLTSEPVRTRADVEKIVDAYRARWTIEEFFKALKTGCAFEKRQLESLSALRNALAVFSVVAWRLLLLRSVSRTSPSAPGTSVASARQIALLRVLPELGPRFSEIVVPEAPTAKDILLAVAELGGHIKNNGSPGWQIIGRGYDALLLLEVGWKAREKSPRYDQ